jgi:DGQHR domain-containing protein
MARRPRSQGTRPQATHRFSCLTFKQGTKSLVLFNAPAKTLWSIVQINQRMDDKEEGYQRTLSPARVGRIAQFVDAGNVLPTSLLVSFDQGAKVSDDGRTLTVPKRVDAGWVIDGQHRLAGAHKAERDISVPVVAFLGLSTIEQINCFVTINREQKGVPTSLYYELLKYLPGHKNESDVAKERAADLADLLKRDETSPFFRRIVTVSAPKVGELSLTNFVRRVSPHLNMTRGRLAIYPDETRAGVLNNIYRALSAVFHKEYSRPESIFFKTLGFGAVMAVLPTVLDVTLQTHQTFSVEAVSATFKRIDYIDFAAWQQRGTGVQVENAAADDLRTELLSAVAGDKDSALKL